MKEYIKKKLKKKTTIVALIVIVSSLIIGSTYGYFVLSTDNYNASELLIAELLYGIQIEEDGSNISTINGSNVVVPSGQKAYYNITISSINKVDSKYTLGYKSTNNSIVKYTDKTDWGVAGYIKGYDETTYTKRIRIVIDNTNESSEANVTFKVYGGYTFNSYDKIELKDNYYTVSGPYKETITKEGIKLTEIIKEDTKCESEICTYSGGSINNYIQYPEDIDKTKNIWRIVGNYKEGEKVVAKLISETRSTTTVGEINESLQSIYNSLEEKNIYKTNKFNCSSTGCIESTYTNIGLISTYEYERVGGINSYLSPNNEYFALNNTSVENITSGGIESTTNETTSGIRASIYLVPETKVKGSGTITDPYIITEGSDINLVNYKLNGEETDKEYNWLLENKVVENVTCENGTKGAWNYENNSIKLTEIHTPDNCTINFKDGYKVTPSVIGGVSNPGSPIEVGHKKEAKFTVTPSTGYTLTGATVSCTNSQTGSINQTTGEVTVSNVTSSTTCTVTLIEDIKTLYDKLLADHPTRLTRSSFSVFTTSNTGTLYTVSGNYTEGAKTVYYFAGNALDNWVKFGKNENDEDLYWRIIRTNEDGSVRLLYVGDSMNTTAGYINASQAYNGTYNNPMYVGYMYGSSGSLASNRNNTTNSPIKTVVDNWYNESLNAKSDGTYTYDKYVSRTAIYCNDRAHEGTYSTGITAFNYATHHRLISERQPSYKCGNNVSGTLYTGTNGADNADRFSASTSTTYTSGVAAGNGQLTYPIALMTADEVAFAGGVYGTSSQAWYYYNNAKGSITGDKFWWTMSPCRWNANNAYSVVFRMYGSGNSGRLDVANVYGTDAVRPVLSLKSCTSWVSGDGSVSNPYEVTIDNTCASRDN